MPDPRRAFRGGLRYGWCWEDADVLLAGLAIRPGERCLSVASAGDNAIALLLGDPASVHAIDVNPAQLASLALRVAAIRSLPHGEVLELLGARPSRRRRALYARCRARLDDASRAFLDARLGDVDRGLPATGRFERYASLFGRRLLPWVHPARRVRRLLSAPTAAARRGRYRRTFDTRAWRLLFRLYFSRAGMATLGRSRAQVRHAGASAAEALRSRAARALTEGDPSRNPYVALVLTGAHGEALPTFLRPEHFETVRARIDRLTWSLESLEQHCARVPPASYDALNLSDLFESLSPPEFEAQVRGLVRAARPGARLAYWNLLVDRRAALVLPSRIRSLEERARVLHARDRAFFYGAFRLECVA